MIPCLRQIAVWKVDEFLSGKEFWWKAFKCNPVLLRENIANKQYSIRNKLKCREKKSVAKIWMNETRISLRSDAYYVCQDITWAILYGRAKSWQRFGKELAGEREQFGLNVENHICLIRLLTSCVIGWNLSNQSEGARFFLQPIRYNNKTNPRDFSRLVPRLVMLTLYKARLIGILL